jgi:hypothetical protein
MIQIDFPKIIAVELPKDVSSDPFSGTIDPELVSKALSLNFNGVVSDVGLWLQEPAAGWGIQKTDIGKYVVTHGLGYTNTSLSVYAIKDDANAEVLEHGLTSFTVQTTVNNQPTDSPWLFTLARVISQPAQP